MKIKATAILLALPLVLTACSGRSDAEKAVREVLKDPESAKFGEYYFNSETGKACLTTNAKNSMGGYTGDSQSHLIKDKEGWHYDGNAEETHAACSKAYADGGGEELLANAVDDPSTMK